MTCIELHVDKEAKQLFDILFMLSRYNLPASKLYKVLLLEQNYLLYLFSLDKLLGFEINLKFTYSMFLVSKLFLLGRF